MCSHRSGDKCSRSSTGTFRLRSRSSELACSRYTELQSTIAATTRLRPLARCLLIFVDSIAKVTKTIKENGTCKRITCFALIKPNMDAQLSAKAEIAVSFLHSQNNKSSPALTIHTRLQPYRGVFHSLGQSHTEEVHLL